MKECRNCGDFLVYYIRSYKGYSKRKTGYCKRFDNTTSVNENCYLWNSNADFKEKRKHLCLETLAELAGNIAEMVQILKEETEE